MDISLVVCTYNRSTLLTTALASLIHQEGLKGLKWEIVVIDDGSTDDTCSIVARLLAEGPPIPIRYLHSRGHGVAAARNHGVAVSQGRFIAFFDDDQWAETRWLAELYEVATNDRADCVGGAMLLDLPCAARKQLGPFCRGLLGETLFRTDQRDYIGSTVPGTGNVLIRRALFQAVGGFDEHLIEGGEDTDFFWKTLGRRIVIRCAPRAIAHHTVSRHRLSPRYFRYAAMRQGLSMARVRFRHKGILRWFLALCRWTARASLEETPMLIISLLSKNDSEVMDRRCRLWTALGYMIGSLSLFGARALPRGLARDLNFRTAR